MSDDRIRCNPYIEGVGPAGGKARDRSFARGFVEEINIASQ